MSKQELAVGDFVKCLVRTPERGRDNLGCLGIIRAVSKTPAPRGREDLGSFILYYVEFHDPQLCCPFIPEELELALTAL